MILPPSQRANLRLLLRPWADLRYMDLAGANLADADLHYADLTGANLADADLTDAYLYYANLSGADLTGANLSSANMIGADLAGANLADTILDPSTAVPHPSIDDLDQWGILHDDIYVYGYRTQKSSTITARFANVYEVGKVYTAPWFSVDQDSDCHPGIYFWPLWVDMLGPLFPNCVYCRSRIVDCLRAKVSGWRTKRLEIISKGEIPCMKE